MSPKQVLGILGGVGPLASAQFVLSIYEHLQDVDEQDMIALHLSSDPSFPDRTDALLSGQKQELLTRTQQSLDILLRAGVTRLVICCFTLHHLLPDISSATRARILSLPALALQELQRIQQPTLLLCTTGTRKLRVFEADDLWSSISQYVVWPDQVDQEKIHRLIYSIKSNMPIRKAYAELLQICSKYSTSCWMCGCTELHLISRCLYELTYNQSSPVLIDPLMIIAENIGNFALL